MTEQVPALLGRSAVAAALDADISAAARSDAKVLITGESGVGKEVAARLIHERSGRRQQPMVALNCAGVPDTLLESELFGHVRGSFTGAYRDKPGIFEAANGGTVFLDEVGEMSLRMQASLLRFLESGELQRVGADRPVGRLNLRVICATNRDLLQRIAAGEFREDLYYRLNVICIQVPPLRDRPDDLPEFIDHFLRHFAARHHLPAAQLSREARALLLSYRWPGNIRELKNVIERVVVRARQGEVSVADLPVEVARQPIALQPAPAAQVATTRDALANALARELFGALTEGRATFWTAVYDPFMNRDLTRDTVRRVVALGAEHAAERGTTLADLFQVARSEQKRFFTFLRKHDCQAPPTVRSGHDGGSDGKGNDARVA